jgi:hypothetical protein
MIKLIAIDMDGTLLNSQKEISDLDKKILQKAAKAGIKIVLCTGRPKSGITPYFDQLNLSDEEYVIGNNGCLTMTNKDWELLHTEGVDAEDLEDLEALLADFPQLNLVLFTPEANYVLGREINAQTKRDAEIEFSKIFHTDLPSFKEKNIPVLVPIFMGETRILDDFQERFDSQLSEEYNTVRSLDYAFEALPMGISKATALARLADDLGIRKEEIMAIGDGNNDLEMLEFAGLSVAMANAKVAVKKIAQVETSSNDQSGVAQAILKYALNSSRLRDEQI